MPANVTSVFVETWGGGGGGFNVSGGGSGGYASAKIPVIAGQVINLSIGAGGYGSGIFSPAYNGGNTTITTAAITVTAGGGFAAQSGSIFTNNSETYIAPVGGTFSFAGLSKDYYGVKGNVGFLSKINFVHVNDTEFAKVYEFGNGGDAPFFPNSGGKGGYNFVSTTYNYRGLATIFPSIPGAGGAADINSSSKYGAPGMVIVRW